MMMMMMMMMTPVDDDRDGQKQQAMPTLLLHMNACAILRWLPVLISRHVLQLHEANLPDLAAGHGFLGHENCSVLKGIDSINLPGGEWSLESRHTWELHKILGLTQSRQSLIRILVTLDEGPLK